ncbi:MAG: PH domain-containing protein [Bacteroidia bacterium]
MLFFVATLIICYVLSPGSYVINETDLIIKRPAGDAKIKLSDIAEIRMANEGELKWMLRTFGNGGLFGYYGKYFVYGIGTLTLYTTKLTNRIFIQTKQGKKFLISPDDTSLAVMLKEKLTLK